MLKSCFLRGNHSHAIFVFHDCGNDTGPPRRDDNQQFQEKGRMSLSQDVRYGLRSLGNNPAFTSVSVIVLALGIGANTAIFSLVNGVLLQPLPYSNPGRLVQLRERSPDFSSMSVSYPNFLDWQASSRSFAGMAAYRWEDYDLTGGGPAEHLSGKMVSADFFRVLGICPVLGRDFDPKEDILGTTPVVVIGGGLWERRFGSSPGVIGKQLTLSARDYTVVGVVPAEFQLQGKADVYTLMGQWDSVLAKSRDMHPGIQVVASLQPGVTHSQARSDMEAIAAYLAKAYPKANAKHGVNLVPLTQVIVGNVRHTLLILLGAVGFVLLIACANVANLLLARAAGRRREMAIRSALGAGRGRVARQLLTESVVLAFAGGAAGLAIAKYGARALIGAVPGGLPRMENIGVDGWVLAFTLTVSLLTGIVFGLAPALQISACDLNETLKEGGRGSTAGPHRLRNLLVVSEVAAALLLVVGAGLMLRTMWRLNAVNPGFDPHNLLTFSVGLSPADSASSERVIQSLDQTVERIRGVPGVKSAALTTLLPMAGNDSEIPFYVSGRPRPSSQGDMLWALLYTPGPGYFEAMDIPLLRGRFIAPRDTRNAARVVVIDEVMAHSVFPSEDPLGKSIIVADLSGNLGPELTKPMEIVGVVGHVKHWGLDNDLTAKVRSEIYIPFVQIPDPFLEAIAGSNIFVVRTGNDALSMVAAVRRSAREAGPGRPVFDMRTMDQIVAASLEGRRFSMLLLGIFAGLALLLAAVGIYGVVSYSIAQRTNEIGIRMALGARPRDVLRVVVSQAMMPALAGVAIGLAAAAGLTRLMANMLYGVEATDPLTFLAVAVAIAFVALLASCIPGLRAMKIEPTIALRHE
ncbi:MAG TPA: ABC transporter permease [Bryobacteraceae bacterium]|nr:ABC transporter permease [Bryobacteraceae bacterium]